MQNDNAAHADLSLDSLTDKWIYAVCHNLLMSVVRYADYSS
jgi:hypothetical protein